MSHRYIVTFPAEILVTLYADTAHAAKAQAGEIADTLYEHGLEHRRGDAIAIRTDDARLVDLDCMCEECEHARA